MTVRLMLWAPLICLLAPPRAIAQPYPSRTVTIVGATAAGATTDVLARAVGQRLSEKWGQSVVIENKPGGAYAIAALAVARADPDGYTLLASELGLFTVQPHLQPPDKRRYDAEKDLAPIAGIASIPIAVMASPSLPVKSMVELIALAKARPDTISYGTAGQGTVPHLGALLLQSLTGTKLTAVHYRGVSPALNDVIAGHINLIIMGPSIGIPSYRAGKLSILGIADNQPMKQLPDVPTVATTVPGYVARVGFGLSGPATLPTALVQRINADVQQIVRDTEFQAKFFEPQLLQPMHLSADQLVAEIRAESSSWEKIIREVGLRIE